MSAHAPVWKEGIGYVPGLIAQHFLSGIAAGTPNIRAEFHISDIYASGDAAVFESALPEVARWVMKRGWAVRYHNDPATITVVLEARKGWATKELSGRDYGREKPRIFIRPMALSIRQPWAWLIAHGHKDIENRGWPTKYRGEFLIHASSRMSRAEYEDARYMAGHIDSKITLPAPEELQYGGIVGTACIYDCVETATSPWFVGRHGFAISAAHPCEFRKLKGQLGFFDAATQEES